MKKQNYSMKMNYGGEDQFWCNAFTNEEKENCIGFERSDDSQLTKTIKVTKKDPVSGVTYEEDVEIELVNGLKCLCQDGEFCDNKNCTELPDSEETKKIREQIMSGAIPEAEVVDDFQLPDPNFKNN